VNAVEQSVPVSRAVDPELSFSEEFRSYWHRVSDKGLFLGLLGAWCLLFHVFGTSSFNFSTTTSSLFQWMYNAWNAPMLDSSQGNLIPFVVVILLWVKRRELADSITGWWWPGLAPVGLALVLHIVGFLAQQPRLSMVGLFFGIYSLTGLVWGWKTMKAGFFPFMLFAFCMPFGTFVENVTLPLRLFATKSTYLICNGALGIPVWQHGTELYDKTGTINFDVAPACSGIRSFVALLAVTTVFSMLAFQRIWKRGLIIALTVPLVVTFNIIRLVAIILATQSINKQAGLFVHEWFGFFTYMMAIACLMAVAHWMRDKPLTATA
jgi:exosortase